MTGILQHTRNIILLSSILVLWLSCKPGVPNHILSEREMQDILYDYHIAKGLANQKSSDSISYYTHFYQKKVFDKYGIDEAEFDSSMIWYSRHTKRLSNIYKKLAERMGSSSEVVPGSNFLASGESSADGDTLNMWPLTNSVMIHSKGMNYSVFREKTDTLIHPGDRLLWKFSMDWYYNEGSKQGVAMLVAKFKNDSVISTIRPIYESASGTELSLHIGNDTVKEVEGFIYQITPWTKRPRILNVSDIQLLRIKSKSQKLNTETRSNGILMQNMGF